MASDRNAAARRQLLLDVVVLIAMAITATAFAAGLIVHSGIDVVPGMIAGAALYAVMAACHFVVTRGARGIPVAGRLDELEEALQMLDTDLQRIDQVEDDVARLDLLNDRVERLDRAASGHEGPAGAAGAERVEQLASDFEELHGRIEGLRSDLRNEVHGQREKISSELRQLEAMIKQLSRELVVASAVEVQGGAEEMARGRDVAAAAPTEEPLLLEDEPAEIEPMEIEPMEIESVEIESVEIEPMEIESETILLVETPAPVASIPKLGALDLVEREAEEELLDIVRQSIERNRIELYLQPTVTLPERKVRYYEALTRMRTMADDLMLPGAFIPVAARAGLMPLIDNVALVKSVQALRRLPSGSKLKGIFCNIAVQSLLDTEFFPELVEFMEENSALSENLFFEVSQRELRGLGASELESLNTLGALGFRFSLDHVADLDVDFAALRDRHFRFVKIEAITFLRGMEETGARAADLRNALEPFGLELIVEKVEDEDSVAKLMDYGVELAQGHLFAEPKPLSPEMFRELEEADAA
jgi:cyclic-di-GMP phosphodiesterase, flagellum assembly factor TipF